MQRIDPRDHGVRRRAALSRCAAPALAQAPVEVSFYYPGRRRRPDHQDHRRLRRGLREGESRHQGEADLLRQLPGIDHQGADRGEERRAAGDVDPAVDRHVHADRRGRDRAVRRLIKTADDQAWLKSFYPAFMENSQTGGKTWGIPFQRSTIVLYYNKELFKEAGLDPNKPPANWKEMAEYAQKLTKRDASGKVTQWGVQIPSSGFPYWLFQGLAIENGASLMNAAGTETYYDKPEVIARAAVLGRPREEAQGASGRHRRVGHDAEGLLREEGRDDVDHHRQPHQREEQRQVRLRRRDAAGGQAARQPDRRRQLLPLQEDARRRSARPRSSSSSG